MFSRRGLALLSGSALGAAGVAFGHNRFAGAAAASQPRQQQQRQGIVFTFGSNEYGQLGVDTPGQASAVPSRVEGQLRDRDVRQVAAGDDHVLALDAEGALFSWGRSQYQNLGYQSDTVVDTPVRVTALSGVPIAQVAASSTNSYAVDIDGRLWSWGRAKALGRSLGDFGFGSGGDAARGSWRPQPLPILSEVLQVAAGHGFAMALTRGGQVFSWGDNSRGALGLGGRDDHEVPTPVAQVNAAAAAASDPIRKIAAGSQFALLLSEQGRIWFCGGNDYGQAGSMARRYQREPVVIESLGESALGKQHRVSEIAAGRGHCAAVSSDGQVWCWGLGQEGQIGIGTRQTHNPTPVAVQHEFGGSRVVKVACGGSHTAAVTEDGRLWCWGRGRESQLGQADGLTSVAAAALVPQEVTWFRTNGYRVVDVALGNSFTCVLALADPDAATLV